MNVRIFPVHIISISLLYLLSDGSVPDTTPPTGRLIDPRPFTVITQNTILFQAEAMDSGSGIKEVRFCGHHASVIDSSTHRTDDEEPKESVLLGRATEPPYKFFWDCSKIPDQDMWRPWFWCDIEDSAGNILEKAGGIHKYIVIDRNPDTLEKKFMSKKRKGPIITDGSLDEWPPGDTLKFKNGNNTITALSVWDRDSLYLGIRIQDEHFYSPKNDPSHFWWWDCLQIYFDWNCDRTYFRKLDDMQVNIGILDTFKYHIVDLENDHKGSVQQHGMNCVMKVHGTMNESGDKDTAWILETAFEWKTFGKSPKAGMSIGFDIFNIDNDFGEQIRISKGWSGVERYNNNNPTEWGTLVLASPTRAGYYICAAILISAFIIFLGIRSHRKNRVDQSDQAPLSHFERVVRDYMNGNFQNAELGLDDFAAHMNLQKAYFRQKFKKEIGVNFTDFVNDFRLQKAKGLLRDTTLPVLDVALSVGFKSHENFTRLFKKLTGKSPSDWRN